MVATTDHRGCSQKLIATLMMALYGEDVDIELLEQQAAAAASNSNGAECWSYRFRNSDIGLQPGGYLCVVKST
jgi:hypothetical protein